MERPFRTGIFFGLGFCLIAGLFVMSGQIVDRIVAERQLAEFREIGGFGLLDREHLKTSRTQPVVRDGKLFVLVTIHNSAEHSQLFGGEVVLYGRSGDYYDTCQFGRSYLVASGDSVDFKVECPVYGGVDEIATLNSLGDTKLQFFRPSPDSLGY